MSCRVVCSGPNGASAEGPTTSGGKCMRPGPITTNGYLNFLREYRKKHCGLSAVETVRQGAAEWNKLSEQEKNRYTQQVRISIESYKILFLFAYFNAFRGALFVDHPVKHLVQFHARYAMPLPHVVQEVVPVRELIVAVLRLPKEWFADHVVVTFQVHAEMR